MLAMVRSTGGGFFRDNAFLVAAVSLPLLVVGFFLLFTAIPRWTVPAPQHDLLLHTRTWDQTGPRVSVDFAVVDGRVQATVRPLAENVSPHRATLWLVDHTDMSVREVPFAPPERLQPDEPARTIVIEAFAGRRILDQPKAPDGYEVQTRSSGSPGLIGDLFGMRRYDRSVIVANRGRVVPIRIPSVESYASPDFLGWLIDE